MPSNVHRIRKKPGPRVGQPHSGQFKPGADNRRYVHDTARREVRLQLEELCKDMTGDALTVLKGLLESGNDRIKLEAVAQVLDRGWGKSVDRLAIQQVGQAQGSLKDADMATLMGVLESRTSGLSVTNGVTDGREAPLDGECQRIEHPMSDEHD